MHPVSCAIYYRWVNLILVLRRCPLTVLVLYMYLSIYLSMDLPPSEPDIRQQKQQRLIVRNLNFHAKEEDLAKAFAEFGPLAEVRGVLVKLLQIC